MIIKRDIFPSIARFMDSPEAIVITGVRRAGKTTTLQYFFDKIKSNNKLFLDLENPLNQSFFEEENYENIKLTLERLGVNFASKAYIFLDEIQFAQNIPSVVKFFYDHYQTKFFLSGSASFYLKNLFPESLAGRKYAFELRPLNFLEFVRFKGLKYRPPTQKEKIDKKTYSLFRPLYEEYLLFGGFPQVALKQTIEEKNKSLEDIFSSYFQKEVSQLSDFKSNAVVRKFILLLTERVGQKLDIQKIASELGVSRPTVYNLLEFLQGTYFIDLLLPFGKTDTAVRKRPKVYFIDTGILNFLGKVELGRLFENGIFLKLKNKNISYYQKEGKEIDFIVEKTGFETKLFASSSDLKTLKRQAGSLNLRKYFLFSLRYSKLAKTLYGFMR